MLNSRSRKSFIQFDYFGDVLCVLSTTGIQVRHTLLVPLSIVLMNWRRCIFGNPFSEYLVCVPFARPRWTSLVASGLGERVIWILQDPNSKEIPGKISQVRPIWSPVPSRPVSIFHSRGFSVSQGGSDCPRAVPMADIKWGRKLTRWPSKKWRINSIIWEKSSYFIWLTVGLFCHYWRRRRRQRQRR